MQNNQETTNSCPQCGGTHLEKVLRIEFKGDALVECLEEMAARRQEDVGDLIFHLLWLEARKRPGLREKFEDAERALHERHEHE